MAFCHAINHIGESGLRIEAIEFGALQHGIEGDGALAAGFGSEEQEVVAGDGDAARRAFSDIIVDREAAVAGTSDGTVGLSRLEVSVSSGTGKAKMAGGISGAMKESAQRAFSYVLAKKTELGIAPDLETSDLHVEVIDLLGNLVEAEIGVALFFATLSALRKAPITPALLVLVVRTQRMVP
jgi:hypothetical protein